MTTFKSYYLNKIENNLPVDTNFLNVFNYSSITDYCIVMDWYRYNILNIKDKYKYNILIKSKYEKFCPTNEEEWCSNGRLPIPNEYTITRKELFNEMNFSDSIFLELERVINWKNSSKRF